MNAHIRLRCRLFPGIFGGEGEYDLHRHSRRRVRIDKRVNLGRTVFDPENPRGADRVWEIERPLNTHPSLLLINYDKNSVSGY